MNTYDIGMEQFQALMPDTYEDTLNELGKTSFALKNSLVSNAFGTIYRCSSLSRFSRQLSIISLLASEPGNGSQLDKHVRAALQSGVDPDEIISVIELISVYRGFPAALNALTCINQILASQSFHRIEANRFLELPDHTTTVYDSNNKKEPIVLVHALGLDWRMWRDVIPNLETEFRVIAYDLRGFGSAAKAPEAKDINDYAEDLRDILSLLQLPSAHIAGLSLGGSIAQALCTKQPELFKTLTIIASTGWSFPAFRERKEAAIEQGVIDQISPSLTRWFTPDQLATNGWGVRYARDCVARSHLGGWCAGWNALFKLNIDKQVEDIRVKTHIIAAECDLSTPPVLMEKFCKIKNHTFTVIPNAPHMVGLTHPRELATSILANIK